MAIPEGLRTALNEIRETSIDHNTLYAQYIEEIMPTTDIGTWASPILEVQKVMISADVSRNKRKKVVDTLAATLILQSYLDSIR